MQLPETSSIRRRMRYQNQECIVEPSAWREWPSIEEHGQSKVT